MTVTLRFAPSPTGRISYRQSAHRAVQLAVPAAAGRPLRPALRRHRQRALAAPNMPTRSRPISPGSALHPIASSASPTGSRSTTRAAERLKAAGLLYPCYETPDELDRKRKRLAARGLPPVYGREALRLTDAEKAALRGRGPAAALALSAAEFRGRSLRAAAHGDPPGTTSSARPQTVDLASLSDPVLIRGRRQLSLHAAVDRRRRRPRHFPRHPRRRPRHQYRRPDRDLPRPGPDGAGLRPPQSPDDGLGRGPVEAERRPVPSDAPGGGLRADGASPRWRSSSACPARSTPCRILPRSASGSHSARPRPPPRSSIPPNSTG